jgi:hypothetical protein
MCLGIISNCETYIITAFSSSAAFFSRFLKKVRSKNLCTAVYGHDLFFTACSRLITAEFAPPFFPPMAHPSCFGLSFLTQLFCFVMHKLLKDIKEVECYVDDCVIASKPEYHAALVKEVIDKLTSVNLRINYEKCTWRKTSIYMLGFVVGPGVIKLDMRRLSDIDNMFQIPRNAKQVRSLMGVISYMRDFVPMISKIASPIDALRNCKDSKFNWTALHTKRLQALKEILLSNAIVHTPKMDQWFYLETDASL